MGGHTRTVGTARAVVAEPGKVRKVRDHRPAGDGSEDAPEVRRKRRNGSRAFARERIARTSDPVKQTALALDYVKSAAAKYQPDPAAAQAAVAALLAMGDRIYADGVPLTAGQKRYRKTAARRHRIAKDRKALLLAQSDPALRQRGRKRRRA
ncbi:hypothetical protein [Amycolatopsis sp. NPDC004079]|uniref:hypothetical protein n=1 Tax=Amycolatopsis sp. NPDC004079 TaxID=3154549 RepID=UPI00339DDE32